MRRLPADTPYTFRPPRPVRAWRPLLFAVNDHWFLRRAFRVTRVDITGADPVADLVRAGHTTLITPNHADHADPHVLLETDRRHHLGLRFMATRELFDVSPLHAWALQRFGAFSVDREGADLAAFRTAMDLLTTGRHPLVIFPEGEVYLHHEQLDPLHEGAAAILLKAFAKLPPDRDAFLVPLALRYRHDPSVTDSFAPRLDALEQHLGWQPRADLDTVTRIHRLGSGALALREVEWLGQPSPGELPARLRAFAEHLLSDAETAHGRDRKATTIPERYRAIRGRLRKRLLDEEHPPTPAECSALSRELDRLFVAFQAYSYPGEYLTSDPTRHRIAETLMKLEEDLLGECVYAADRTAHVCFGAPVSLRQLAATDPAFTAKSGAAPLTAHLESLLAALLASA